VSDHCIYYRVQLESARCHSTLFGRSRPPNAERNERVSTKRRGATNADSCWRPRRELRCWYASILFFLSASINTHVTHAGFFRSTTPARSIMQRGRLFWQNRPHLGEITSQFCPRSSLPPRVSSLGSILMTPETELLSACYKEKRDMPRILVHKWNI